MSPDQEHRLEEIFSAARDLPRLERTPFLDRACADDAELRRQADSLLAAHEQAGRFLQPTVALSTSNAPAEKPGDRIGRYKLLEQIGEGGFGIVWMAEQEEPVRRRVALKIIKLGMDTREVVARFEAERQALAMMDHPNIAIVFDGGATDTGRPYFVMELVKGVPITDYCDANKFSTRERLELFMQVCQAVQHAHQKGIIHRDIKPSNILVTVKDDRPVPKVIDFGVAKATQARLTEKTVFTRLHQWIGTPAYMSPEQAGLGSLDVDTRSDVYSLGVLLYELLTGRPPFDTQRLLTGGYDAVMRTIREEEPPKPSTRLSTLADEELSLVAAKRSAEPAKLNRLVRGDVDWIVMKSLEKDRSRRYETAIALADDVERHLLAEPVSAAAPDLFYRAGKFMRRNRTRLAFGALATIAVALAIVGGKFALNYQTSRQSFRATGTNAVFTLAKSGDAGALRRLLDANPRLVNERDAGGSTPLAYAACAGNTNTLPVLLAYGAAVDATDHAGLTPLGNATANNRVATALMLLGKGADPNHADASGVTPLHAASWFGSVEIGRALLTKGARTDAVALTTRVTALGQAAMVGHADFVYLLLAHDASTRTRDANGNTPLHAAASGQSTAELVGAWKGRLHDLTARKPGDESLAPAVEEMSNRMARVEATLAPGSLRTGGDHRRVAESLLAHGAAIEATNSPGCTPLWVAACFSNPAVAQVLIAHKANLNARALNGFTPLNAAARKGVAQMAALLLQSGADANLPDTAGFTPLHIAVENGYCSVVQVLLVHGADPNLACPGGQTPLHTAAARGDLETMRLLLEKGAYLHAQAREGTPLSSAIGSGVKAAVEFLLQRGVNPNAATPEGETPLHFAALLGQPVLVELLLQRGASNNSVGQVGTPLHIAVAGRETAREWSSSATHRAPQGWQVHPPALGSNADYETVVKLLLASGADVNAREPAYQRTPIFIAVRAGNTAAVDALLAAHADISACDTLGTTVLHAVSESQAPAVAVSNIVVRLLKAGAAPEARDARRATPLHAAAYGGRPDVAALLIAAGANVNAPGPFLATPLHLALRGGHRELVQLLLANGADPERRGQEGVTALHIAVFLKSKDCVTLLLQHDADANAAKLDGTTPLMLAAMETDVEIVRLLLAHGAKLDMVDQGSHTPLHAAASGGSAEIVKFLLDNGAKLDREDREGNTALMLAAKFDRLEAVKFLIERGAPLNERNSQGFTLLHMAADHGHAELVEFLLGRGLDVNSRGTTQYTPLHCAANGYFTNEVHYLAVIKVLLAHGAEVNARMQGNQTPLHRAANWGRPQILQALLTAGADATARDDDGKTALDLAAVNDDPRLRPGVAAGRKECADLLRGNRQVQSSDTKTQKSP